MSPDPKRAFISRHAHARCVEMRVQRDEVVETLVNPWATYPSSAHYGAGRRISVGGRLAVVHTDDWVVVTVLWNGQNARAAVPAHAA